MKYKNLFFDLDDTLWAFSQNAYDTFEEVYDKYRLGQYFDSFSHFYSLYQRRNTELWVEYGNGQVTKEELNRQRFYILYKLLVWIMKCLQNVILMIFSRSFLLKVG